MSDFKAKMNQIRFPLGSAPDPAEEAYSAPQTSELYLRGRRLKGGERGTGEGRGGRG